MMAIPLGILGYHPFIKWPFLCNEKQRLNIPSMNIWQVKHLVRQSSKNNSSTPTSSCGGEATSTSSELYSVLAAANPATAKEEAGCTPTLNESYEVSPASSVCDFECDSNARDDAQNLGLCGSISRQIKVLPHNLHAGFHFGRLKIFWLELYSCFMCVVLFVVMSFTTGSTVLSALHGSEWLKYIRLIDYLHAHSVASHVYKVLIENACWMTKWGILE